MVIFSTNSNFFWLNPTGLSRKPPDTARWEMVNSAPVCMQSAFSGLIILSCSVMDRPVWVMSHVLVLLDLMSCHAEAFIFMFFIVEKTGMAGAISCFISSVSRARYKGAVNHVLGFYSLWLSIVGCVRYICLKYFFWVSLIDNFTPYIQTWVRSSQMSKIFDALFYQGSGVQAIPLIYSGE